MDETKKLNAEASHWRRVKLKVGFISASACLLSWNKNSSAVVLGKWGGN